VGNVEEDYHNIDDAHMDDDGIYGDHHDHDHADEDGQMSLLTDNDDITNDDEGNS